MDACLLEGIDVEERKSERFEKKYRKVYIYILLNLDKYFFLREELNIFEMISMMLVRQGIID